MEKKGGGRVIGIVIAGVLVVGAAVAGSLLGPRLLHQSAAAEPKEAEPEAEHAESPIGEVLTLDPILVDTRAQDGSLHHLKVVLALELKPDAPKEEVLKYTLRGREAAVAYLRETPYETVAAPEHYDEVRKELYDRMIEPVGKKRVVRVLVTDFIAQ